MNIPTLIYCADGNKRFADIAIKHGFRYGSQLPRTIYHVPYFCDQNWRNPRREEYIDALAQYRPALATVLDLEREDQLGEVLGWCQDAAPYVREALIVIPKVRGIISRLPREVDGKPIRLGYSVPTRFAGTQVPQWEFLGWPVHLLGGSPGNQLKLARYLDVRSADGNYVANIAIQFGRYWGPATAPKLKETYGWLDGDAPYFAFELSCINIKAAWSGSKVNIRFAAEKDIDGIKHIANQYKQELGFVNKAALRSAIDRRELYIAERKGRLLGFVHWHARRDGWNTIYEIAVHRDWCRQGVGQALVASLPRPLRLKVTTDNTRAIEFYERQGFAIVETEAGRKRPLYLMQLDANFAGVETVDAERSAAARDS